MRISIYWISGLFLLAFPDFAFAQGVPVDQPLLIEPVDQAEIFDTTAAIVLSWSEVDLASTYEVQHFFSEPVDGQEPIPLKTKVLSDVSSEILVADLLDLRAALDPEGDSTFHWRVRARNADGEGPWSEVWEFTLIPLDGAPQIDAVDAQMTDEEALFTLDINATSPTGSALTYNLDQASMDAGMTIDPVAGEISWTPSEDQGPGSYEVTVTVSDEAGNESTLTFTIDVNEVNLPPVLDPVADQNAEVGVELVITAVATDPDIPVNTLTYSLDQASLDAGMTIDPATGEITWTPTADQDMMSFTVEVTVTDDGDPAASDVQTFAVQVGGNNPIIDAVDAQVTDEEVLFGLDINATSPTGSALTYNLDQASLDAGMTIDPVTGEISWTPSEDQGPGSYEVTVTVSDEAGNESTLTFTIDVNEVNLPPVLDPVADQNAEVGVELVITAVATDPDIPENTLTYSLDQASLDAGMMIDPATGEITWTPTADQDMMSFTVEVTVTDDGDPAASDVQTFAIVVGDTQSPVIIAVDDQSVNELELFSITVEANDPNNSDLTFALDQASIDAGMVIDPATGELTWTPGETQGPASFEVTVSVVNAAGLEDTDTFNISVEEVNLAPEITQLDDVTVLVGEAISFDVEATDPDTLAPAPFTFNTLSYVLSDTTASGMNIDPATGSFTWQSDVAGTYPVTVTVMDDGTPAMSSSVSFTITVDNITTVTSTTPETAPFCSAASDFDISWAGVPADGFIVQFSDDPAFNTIIDEVVTTTTSAKAPLASLEFGRTYYWRVITTLSGQQSEPSEATPFSRWPAEIQVSHTLSFDKANEPADFRMISVPGQSTSIPIVSTFSGTQAPAGPLPVNGDWDWSIWRDNGASAAYEGYIDQNIAQTPFSPGVGYWGISKSAWQVPEQVIDNAPLDVVESRFFAIPLNEGTDESDARWTMIGNPFNFPVLWQDLVDENGLTTSFDLWDWTGERYESVSVMQPYKGYYYFNANNDPTLRMPCLLTPVSTNIADREEAPAITVSLHADQDAATQALSVVKVLPHAKANDGLDRFDRVVPPAFFEKHRITLINRQLGIDYPFLAEEARASFETAQTFNLELKSEPGDPVYLNVRGFEHLIHQEIYLFDDVLGQVHDLRQDQTILFESREEPVRLRLLIGDRDFIASEEAELVPDGFKLQKSYPNPFVDRTMIEYALPESEHVSLEIYNMLGQRVRTLIDREAEAGYHRAVWDGATDAGLPAASGTYIYVFRSPSHQATGRVIRIQ